MQITRSVVLASTLLRLSLTPFSAIAQEKSHVTSEQVTHAIQEIEKIAQKKIQENAVPGVAVAVVFQDKVAYAKGLGVRDVNTKTPVDADTVFQLASVSKPIGSTVVAALVGEGKINWDSMLSVLDSGFAMFDPWVTREITICDMYSHRSGLPDHAGDLLEDLGFTRAEIVEGPKNKMFPMKHYQRDTFTYQTEGENAVGVSGITFTIAPDGKATRVLVENLNAHREGTFKRMSTLEP